MQFSIDLWLLIVCVLPTLGPGGGPSQRSPSKGDGIRKIEWPLGEA